MNDRNKHTPLSAEELFKLLKERNENSLPEGELDDFEKDALEGFSQYSSVEKAKSLTEEINIAINKKVSEKKTKPVAKIVWFSAAASLILLVMLSVYFLTQTTKEETSSLALNKEIPAKEQPVLLPPAEESESKSIAENKPADKVTANASVTPEPFALARNEKTSAAQGPVMGGLEKEKTVNAEVSVDLKDEEYKVMGDISKEKGNIDSKITSGAVSQEITYTAAPSVNYTAPSVNYSAPSNNGTTINVYDGVSRYSVQQNVSLEKSAKEESTLTLSKPNKAKAKESKKRSEETVAASGKADSDKADDLSRGHSSDAKVEGRGTAANVEAYYPGGEEAIKKYIVSRLNQDNSVQPLKGTYKITVKVLTDGRIVVETINSGKNGDINVTESLRKVLNGMSGWNPAVSNGYISISNVNLELNF